MLSAIHIPVTTSAAADQDVRVQDTLAAEPARPKARPLGIGLVAAMLLGIGCILAALVTGILFSQQTFADWQAVQAWRIQWLLGAIAFFLLGLLLHALRGDRRD